MPTKGCRNDDKGKRNNGIPTEKEEKRKKQ